MTYKRMSDMVACRPEPAERSSLWSPPLWAKSKAWVKTTDKVVFPGSALLEGEPQSRTPDWLCLSQSDGKSWQI